MSKNNNGNKGFNFDFEFIKSIDVNDQQKTLMLLTLKELIWQTLDDEVINTFTYGLLITSITRMYLYAEVINTLSKNNNLYQTMQNFISELSSNAIEDFKKEKEKENGSDK